MVSDYIIRMRHCINEEERKWTNCDAGRKASANELTHFVHEIERMHELNTQRIGKEQPGESLPGRPGISLAL